MPWNQDGVFNKNGCTDCVCDTCQTKGYGFPEETVFYLEISDIYSGQERFIFSSIYRKLKV
jgi:hypothetical protein